MSVLIGHPTGGMFSHHAALAYLEVGKLEAFCVPWMPSRLTLDVMAAIKPLQPLVRRLGRRSFAPLRQARTVQGRIGEMRRMLRRARRQDEDELVREANQWLMTSMSQALSRPAVSAVHAYEDCSLLQFKEAKRRGRNCIYDLPIGYYPAWQEIQAQLVAEYRDWLPQGTLEPHASVEQKKQELALADVILVPSRFVADTVHRFHPQATVKIVPYGTDSSNGEEHHRPARDTINFLFAGQCSVRKGIPLLLKAWREAALDDGRLKLVGSWALLESKKREFPPNCTWEGPVSLDELHRLMQQADVFVFPTNFEGQALVIGEALAAGLPVLTTSASGTDDIVDDACGMVVPPNDLDALVDAMRWFAKRRDVLPQMGLAARQRVEHSTWRRYRDKLVEATASLI